MGALNKQIRCKHCGERLKAPTESECPGCHSGLGRVGICCELLDWGKTRQIGRNRYILKRFVLGWGGLMSFSMCLGYYLRGDTTWPVYAGIVFLNLVVGYCLGRWFWQAAEREYALAAPQDGTR
jgi:hypothetical protein